MPDIAELGLKIDSSQVERGSQSLDKLVAAAGRAEGAAKGFSSGAKGASSAADAAAASLGREASAAAKTASALDAAARAANENGKRMSGSFSGLAAQFQDIGVTAASGMNPLIIGLQQGTQIAGQMEVALQGGASAAAIFGTAIKSLISPVSLLSIGFTILAAAGLQMVNWAGLAKGALNGLASVLVTISPYATLAAAGLALLYAPTVIAGLLNVVTSLGAVAGAIRGVALAIYAAIGLPALLVAGFVALVAAAVIWRDDLTKMLGFDIVGAAQTGVNTVVGLFVGAYNAVRDTWSLLPAAFKDIFTLAMNGAIDIVQNGVNGITGSINSVLSFVHAPTIGNTDLSGFKGQTSGALGQLGSTVSDDMKAAQGVDYVGKAVTFVQNAASSAADKLRNLANSIDLSGNSSKKAVREAAKQAQAYQDIVRGAQQHIAASQLEALTLGMTTEQINAQRYAQELLNKAANDHINLTPKQTQELTALGAAMAAADAATQQLIDAYNFGKDVFGGFFSDLKSNLKNGQGLWESFGNAAASALDKIADKALSMAADGIFDLIWNGGSSSSKGGGGLGGVVSSVISSIFGHNANGTSNWRGGLTWVGERGPELVNLPKGSQVFNARQSASMASNDNAPVVQIIDQRNSGSIQRQQSTGPNGEKVLRVLIRDEVQEARRRGAVGFGF
jgi:hypothetical protein